MNTIAAVRIACLGATLLGFSAPLAAQVELARVPASACLPVSDVEFERIATVAQNPNNPSHFAGTLASTSNSVRAKMYCPVPDNVAVQAESLRWVHVHVDDGSAIDRTFAIACVTFHSAAGGACSSVARNGHADATGATFLDITDTKWNVNAPSGFAYVYVELPSKGNAGPASNLFGYSAGE